MPPGELLARGREELVRFGGHHLDGRVANVIRDGGRFRATLEDGTVLTARRLVVTTGLVDELPDVPGVADHWGHTVIHCPYCHGWEVRDRHIGVLITSPMSWHQVSLFRQLSDRVVALGHLGPAPDPDQAAVLAARGVDVVDGEVVEIEPGDDGLRGVRLADGRRIPLEVVVVTPRFVTRGGLLETLGLPLAELPQGGGTHVPADPTGRTEIEGVWVAGNVTDPSAQVITAAAQGNRAGAMVNMDLVLEDERHAVAEAATSDNDADERHTLEASR